MFVLIEGPERVGKTTLAVALCEASRSLDVDAVHCRCRGHKALDPWVYRDFLDLGRRKDVLVVCDRAWPSELVYSRLLNRPSSIATAAQADRIFGQVLHEIGIGLVLAPPARRAPLGPDDLVLPYAVERQAFVDFGVRWGFTVVTEDWDTPALTTRVMSMLAGGIRPVDAGPTQ